MGHGRDPGQRQARQIGLFAHGVASGDPLPDGVLLWTRASLESPEAAPVTVRWRVATTTDLSAPVAQGESIASPEHDFCVKADVRGLAPWTTYYFGFECGNEVSPVGRTRTAPAGATGNIRLGVVSCASFSRGFFNAYSHLAERDVDLVVHLGDYVYEDGRRPKVAGRAHEPPSRLRSLQDYRTRHAQYRRDPDLQRLHQQHPLVAVWDDHDIVGNAWSGGAAKHDPATDGTWADRRAAAVQAYLEWLPVRLPDPDRPDRIFRTIGLGDLAQLVMLDTRLAGRERPAKAGERAIATLEEGGRSLLGAEQRTWLRQELLAGAGKWSLLGNQVVMAPLRALQLPDLLHRFVPNLVAGGVGVNSDQWDGYPAERRSLFEFLAGEQVADTVVLSGDLHSSWAAELTLQPKEEGEVVGVELVAPGVTAPSFAAEVTPPVPFGRALLRRLIARQNPHVRYFDLEHHGYLVVDVVEERAQAEWWHVDTVARRRRGERRAARWQVRRGEPKLVPAVAELPPRQVPHPAPL
ncbi:MAG TPA: alkaline phosphatase D family protein [Acidimicrobiales bacterium]|nr:alkaline phosphatase D family protein [Acidimicrobiales bacterium]